MDWQIIYMSENTLLGSMKDRIFQVDDQIVEPTTTTDEWGLPFDQGATLGSMVFARRLAIV